MWTGLLDGSVSYGGEDSPINISRGLFSGELGTPRLLKLLDRTNGGAISVSGRRRLRLYRPSVSGLPRRGPAV
jgi:hypothetical protein